MSNFPYADISVPQAYVSGQLTITDSVAKLSDAAGVADTDVVKAHEVILTFAGADLRYLCDGVDPTTTKGLVCKATAGELRILGAGNLRRLRLIRDGGSGTVSVDFQLARIR